MKFSEKFLALTERGLFDLSSLDEGNRDRLPCWKFFIERLAMAWRGGYYNSDYSSDNRNTLRDLLREEDADWEEALSRYVGTDESYGFSISFRLLDTFEKVRLIPVKKRIWAFGGDPVSNWKKQLIRLEEIDVDAIISAVLPDELPESIDLESVAIFTSKFRFVGPLGFDVEKYRSNFRETEVFDLRQQPNLEADGSFSTIVETFSEIESFNGKEGTKPVCVRAKNPEWFAGLSLEGRPVVILGGSSISILRTSRRFPNQIELLDTIVDDIGSGSLRVFCSRLTKHAVQEVPLDAPHIQKVVKFDEGPLERLLNGTIGEIELLYQESAVLRDRIEECLSKDLRHIVRSRFPKPLLSGVSQGLLLQLLVNDTFDDLFSGLSEEVRHNLLVGAVFWSGRIAYGRAFDAACRRLFEDSEKGFRALVKFQKALPKGAFVTSGIVRFVGYWIPVRNYGSLSSMGRPLFAGVAKISLRCLKNDSDESSVQDYYYYARTLATVGGIERSAQYSLERYEIDSSVSGLLTQSVFGSLLDAWINLMDPRVREYRSQEVNRAISLLKHELEIDRATWETVKMLVRLHALRGEVHEIETLFSGLKSEDLEGHVLQREWAVFEYWIGDEGRGILSIDAQYGLGGVVLFRPLYAFTHALSRNGERAVQFLECFAKDWSGYSDWTNRIVETSYCALGLAGIARLVGKQNTFDTLCGWVKLYSPAFLPFVNKMGSLDVIKNEIPTRIEELITEIEDSLLKCFDLVD